MSRLGLARQDLPRTALSAAVMTNWMPRSLGSMMLRVGSGYIDNTNGNAKAKLVPFIFSSDDTAQLEIVDGELQVRIDDVLIERPTVTAAVTNGTFNTDLSGWTDSDEGSAVSSWLTGGYMALLGTSSDAAIRDQQVTVTELDTEHALRISVTRGPVIIRVGSTSGGDEYFPEVTLGTGTHSLAFTPSGNFYIRLMNRRGFTTLVDSVAVEGAGTMQLPCPWTETDQPLIRKEQSGDIIYVACKDKQQRKISRTGGSASPRSWSIALYEPETGPFRTVNISPITIYPSAISGDITLYATKPYFKSTNVGSLFRIQSTGQTVTEDISAQDTFTNPIRVNGVGAARAFGLIVSGTFVGTVTLQYSVGEPGIWIDATPAYTAPTSTSYNDTLDNQVIYYRIGIKTAGYTSGTATVYLQFSSGSIVGIARVTEYVSSTAVSAVVLADFGAVTPSSDWWEGRWSDRRGWPSAVCLHEGRMSFAGRDRINMAITDSYEDFDDEFEGDAGPIDRTIGEGPVETIPWMLSLNRLNVGTLSSSANIAAVKVAGNNPLSGRSSSFDEPLTPTNFNLKTSSPTGMFVDASTTRLLELKYDINENDYVPEDMTVAVPDLNEIGIVGIAVQYKPDMRVWCWRTDGTAAVLVRDRAENVLCWLEVETDGVIEDVSVMPGTIEDRVYWTVLRGSARFVEKLALESECRGHPEGRLADAHAYYEGAATTTITGLSHLEGETVVCWGWNTTTPFEDDDGNAVGRDFGTFVVSGGQITGLSDAVTNACVGLGYMARWKSGKQAFATALGSALNVRGKIDHIGIIAADMHAQALQYGPSFDDLDDMPMYEEEAEVDEHHVWTDYDFDKLEFDADWKTDPRVCLQAQAPRPVTVLALTVDLTKSG